MNTWNNLWPLAVIVASYAVGAYFQNRRLDDAIAHFEKRFDDMNRRFDDQGKRLDDIVQHFNKRFDDLYRYLDLRFGEIERRLATLEKQAQQN